MFVPTQNPSPIAKKNKKKYEKHLVLRLPTDSSNTFTGILQEDIVFLGEELKKKSSNEIYVRKTFQNRIKQHPL